MGHKFKPAFFYVILKKIDQNLVELSSHQNPLKRNADVSDITPMIKMLLSKESDYINGANIPLTGGSNF